MTDQTVRVVVVVVDERSNQSVLLVVKVVEAMAGQASRPVIVVVAADQSSLCCKWQAGHGGSRRVKAYGGANGRRVSKSHSLHSKHGKVRHLHKHHIELAQNKEGCFSLCGHSPLCVRPMCCVPAGWGNAALTVQCCMDTCCPSG